MEAIAADYFSPYAEAQAEGRRGFEALWQKVRPDAGAALQAVGACIGPGLKLQTLVLCLELCRRLFRSDRFVLAKQALLEDARRSGTGYEGYKDVRFLDGVSSQAVLDFSKGLLEVYLTQYNAYDAPTKDYLLRIYALIVDAAHGLAPFSESLGEFLSFSVANNVLPPLLYFYEEGVVGKVLGPGSHRAVAALFAAAVSDWNLDSPASISVPAAGLGSTAGGFATPGVPGSQAAAEGAVSAGAPGTPGPPEAPQAASLGSAVRAALEFLAGRGNPAPAAPVTGSPPRIGALPRELVADLSGHLVAKLRLLVEAIGVLCRALEAATGCPFLKVHDTLYSVDASPVRDAIYPGGSPRLIRSCVAASGLLLALTSALCGSRDVLRFVGEAGGPGSVGGKPAAETLMAPLADPSGLFAAPAEFSALASALGTSPGQLLVELLGYAVSYHPWDAGSAASAASGAVGAPGLPGVTFAAPTDALRGSAYQDVGSLFSAARSACASLLTFAVLSYRLDDDPPLAEAAGEAPGPGRRLFEELMQHAALLLLDPLLFGVPAFVESAVADSKGVALAPHPMFSAMVVRIVNGLRYVGKAQGFFEMRASFDCLLGAVAQTTSVVLGAVSGAAWGYPLADGGPPALAGLCAADFDQEDGDGRYHELVEQLFEFWYRFSVTISINMSNTQPAYLEWVSGITDRFHAAFRAYYGAHLSEIRRAFLRASCSLLRVDASELVRNSLRPVYGGQSAGTALLAPYTLKFRTHTRLLAGNHLLELSDFRVQAPGARDTFVQSIPFLSADSFYSMVETNCPKCLWEEIGRVQERIPALDAAARALADCAAALGPSPDPREAEGAFAEFCAMEAEFSMMVSYLVLFMKVVRPPASETQGDALFAAILTVLSGASELRYLDGLLCADREPASAVDVYIANRPSRHFAAACQVEAVDYLSEAFSKSSMRPVIDGAVGYMLGAALCRGSAAEAELGQRMVADVEARFGQQLRGRVQTAGELSILQDTIDSVRVWAPHNFKALVYGAACAAAAGSPAPGSPGSPGPRALSPLSTPPAPQPPQAPQAAPGEAPAILPLLLAEFMLSLCKTYVTIGARSAVVLAQLSAFSRALEERQAALAQGSEEHDPLVAGKIAGALASSPLVSFSFAVDQTQRGFAIFSELCPARLSAMLDSQSVAGVLRRGGLVARVLATDFAGLFFSVLRCGLDSVQLNYRAVRLLHTMLASFALAHEARRLPRYQLLCRLAKALMGLAPQEQAVREVCLLHDELLAQMPSVLQDADFWRELDSGPSVAQVITRYWGPDPRDPAGAAPGPPGPEEWERALLANPASRLGAQTLFLMLRGAGAEAGAPVAVGAAGEAGAAGERQPAGAAPRGPGPAQGPLSALQEFVLGYSVSALFGIFQAPQVRDSASAWYLNCVAEPFDRILRLVPPESGVFGLALDFSCAIVRHVRQRNSTLLEVAAPPKLMRSAGDFVLLYASEIFPRSLLMLWCHSLVDNIIDCQDTAEGEMAFPGGRVDSASPAAVVQAFPGPPGPGSTAMSPVGSALDVAASPLFQELERQGVPRDAAAGASAPLLQLLELPAESALTRAAAALDSSAVPGLAYLASRSEFRGEGPGALACLRLAHLACLAQSSPVLGRPERRELAQAVQRAIARFLEEAGVFAALPCVLEMAQNVSSTSLPPSAQGMLLRAISFVPKAWTYRPDGNDFKFLSSVLAYVGALLESSPEVLATLSPHGVRSIVSLLVGALANATVSDNLKFQACRALNSVWRLLCSAEQAQALRTSSLQLRGSGLEGALSPEVLARVLESGRLYSFVTENSAERLGASLGIVSALSGGDLVLATPPGSPSGQTPGPRVGSPVPGEPAARGLVALRDCLQLSPGALFSAWRGGREAMGSAADSATATADALRSSGANGFRSLPGSQLFGSPLPGIGVPLGAGLGSGARLPGLPVQSGQPGQPGEQPCSPYAMAFFPYASFFGNCSFPRMVAFLCDAIARRWVSPSPLLSDMMIRCVQLADRAALLRELSGLSHPGMADILGAVESFASLTETGPDAFRQFSNIFLVHLRKLRRM